MNIKRALLWLIIAALATATIISPYVDLNGWVKGPNPTPSGRPHRGPDGWIQVPCEPPIGDPTDDCYVPPSPNGGTR